VQDTAPPHRWASHSPPLFPPNRTLTLLVFSAVTNTAHLRALVAARTLDVILLDADLIVSPFTVQVSAHRALHAQAKGSPMAGGGLHAEAVYALQGGRNVGEALKALGAREESTNILLGVFDASDERLGEVAGLVLGTAVGVGEWFGGTGDGDVIGARPPLDPKRIVAAYRLAADDAATDDLEGAVVQHTALQELT
jgi:hypothetical protein